MAKVLNERSFRWMLNLYPPLLFNRVRIAEFGPGFRSCRVVVRRSLLTRNLNGTTFGGSIFAGFDPFYPILYWQVFARLGETLQVWLKATEVDYRKPAGTHLTIEFALTDDDVEEARAALDRDGRVVRVHESEAVDTAGDVCAAARCHVYLRRLRHGQKEVSGF